MPQQIISALDYGNTAIICTSSNYIAAYDGTGTLSSYNDSIYDDIVQCGPYNSPGGTTYEVHEAFEAFDATPINKNAKVISAFITINYSVLGNSANSAIRCYASPYPGTRVPITSDFIDVRSGVSYGETATVAYPVSGTISIQLNSSGLQALQSAIANSGRFPVLLFEVYDTTWTYLYNNPGFFTYMAYYTGISASKPTLTVVYEDADIFLGSNF